MKFDAFNIDTALLKELAIKGIDKASPIQEAAIPAVLEGHDLMGIAQTGSGKTLAYVLPLLTLSQQMELNTHRAMDILILAPTRELAVQITEVLHAFAQDLSKPVKILAVYGGQSINPQMKAIKNTNILVATPGRLLDLYKSNALKLNAIKIFVLDEADKMLNFGFEEEMDKIFSLLPKKRQNLLFSATLSEEVKHIKKDLLHEPKVIKIADDLERINQIEQYGYFVTDENKGPLLRHLLKNEKYTQVLVFTSSTRMADNVARKLNKHDFKVKAIHGKKTQAQRNEALAEFKQGKLDALITTDLLARGIDIRELPLVINYELPRSPKDYIHRIGRTGRANAKGLALSFITPDDKHHFKVIQKKQGKWVTMIDSEKLDFK